MPLLGPSYTELVDNNQNRAALDLRPWLRCRPNRRQGRSVRAVTVKSVLLPDITPAAGLAPAAAEAAKREAFSIPLLELGGRVLVEVAVVVAIAHIFRKTVRRLAAKAEQVSLAACFWREGHM